MIAIGRPIASGDHSPRLLSLANACQVILPHSQMLTNTVGLRLGYLCIAGQAFPHASRLPLMSHRRPPFHERARRHSRSI
jgi:hypothetical protein